jgi:hypothetical protein
MTIPAFIAHTLLRLKRFFFNLSFFNLTPSGCGVKVTVTKHGNQKGSMYDIEGLAYWDGKIELRAVEDADFDTMVDILNHEVLHLVLARTEGSKAYSDLDNVQMFRKGGLVFYSCASGKELPK